MTVKGPTELSQEARVTGDQAMQSSETENSRLRPVALTRTQNKQPPKIFIVF